MQTFLRPLMAWLLILGGWLLIALGIVFFLDCAGKLAVTPPTGGARGLNQTSIVQYLEAIVMMIIGIFVFRGGIQIVKVGIAARICLQAHYDAERLKVKPVERKSPLSSVAPGGDW